MKRFLALVLLSATLLGSLFLLSSCSSKTYNGIFYYNIKTDNTDGSIYVSIPWLTDKGEELKTIVIPDQIDGYPVRQVGFHPFWATASFCSSNLERIYLPNTVKTFYISINGKIISMNSNIDEDSTFCSPYFNQIDSIESNYVEVLPDKYANVAYLYNYNDAPGDGIYLLDDYDNEPILYPPENAPVRDGYTFAGWYKEKDCITPWDFTTDIIPSKEFYNYKVVDNDGYIYTGRKQKLLVTQLFAKWEKIG